MSIDPEFRKTMSREARRELVRIMFAKFAETRGMPDEEIRRWTAEVLAADAARYNAADKK